MTIEIVLISTATVTALGAVMFLLLQPRFSTGPASGRLTKTTLSLTSGILVLVVSVVIAAAGVVSIQPARSPGFLEGPVAVGVSFDSPGLSTFGQSGSGPQGFNVDLVNYLSSSSDPVWQPTFVGISDQTAVNFVSAGGGQRVAVGVASTASRLQRVDFVSPYLVSREGIITRSQSGKRIQSAADLTNSSVCALSGSTAVDELRGFNAIVEESLSLLSCFDDLRSARVDAVAGPRIALAGLLASARQVDLIEGFSFGAEDFLGIALPYDSYSECEALRGRLVEFVRSGRWDQSFALNFPGVNPNEFRPDVQRLSPCISR